jgi:hypothetical protein
MSVLMDWVETIQGHTVQGSTAKNQLMPVNDSIHRTNS